MATGPNFAGGSVRNGSAVISSSADTSLTAPTHAVSLFAAGTNGTKIDVIRFMGTGSTVAGTINLFSYDGTTYWIFDSLQIPAITASTTASPFEIAKPYANETLASGRTLYATSTVASQLMVVTAYGSDF